MSLPKLFLFVACFAIIVLVTEAKKDNMIEVPSMDLLKTTYCACKCCEEHKDNCLRHEEIPKDFECQDKKCTKAFCKIWNQAKCSHDCFCSKCQSEISKNDYRCMGFELLPSKCKCDEKYECAADQTVKDLEKKMADVNQNIFDMKCRMPCFCQNCADNIPRQLYADCARSPRPAESCGCEKSKVPCPKFEPEKEEKKQHRKRPIEDDNTKCQMKCFCNKCGPTSDQIREQCEKYLKESPPNCDCSMQDITCPDLEDEGLQKEAYCQLSCFCRDCKNDSRMKGAIKSNCEKVRNEPLPADCECKDPDCDVLDKFNEHDEL